MASAAVPRFVGSTRVVFSTGSPWKRENVLLLEELLEAGKYRPVIDRVYPFEEVAEAARYVESWQKVGNVVLTLNGTRR